MANSLSSVKFILPLLPHLLDIQFCRRSPKNLPLWKSCDFSEHEAFGNFFSHVLCNTSLIYEQLARHGASSLVGVSEVDLTKPSSHKPIWPSAVDKMVRELVGNKDNLLAPFKPDLAEVSCLSGLAYSKLLLYCITVLLFTVFLFTFVPFCTWMPLVTIRIAVL